VLRAPVLLATAALLLAGGCGGDDSGGPNTDRRSAPTGGRAPGDAAPGRYRTAVTRISTQFARAGVSLKSSVGPASTPQQAAQALQQFQSRVSRAAADLDGLAPPQSVQGPHGQLAAAFRGIARACQPAVEAGRAGDRPRLRTALRSLQSKLNGSLGDQAREAAQEIDAGLAGR
jgi:hypothetical protein